MEIVTKYLNERVDSGAVTQQTADKERPELDNMLASLRQWPPVKSDITAWVKAQVDRGNAPSTIGTRLAIANGFFEWCVGERLIEVNPTRGVSRPRVPPKYNRSLTPEEIEAARALMFAVCEKIDQGKRCDKEASMVKLFASEMSERVTSEALQILGGGGYTTLNQVERHWRDARLTKIFEGTSEIQLRIISDNLLGKTPG